MSKYNYIMIRTAAHAWTCARCGRTISKGERYQDHGWYNSCRKWSHVRKHICCCAPDEYPVPVTLQDGTKEWYLGMVHNMEGNPVLLTRDWDKGGQYHFRDCVYDEYGNKMTARTRQE